MRILLLRPPSIASRDCRGAAVTEPLGILYLAAFIKPYYRDIAVIDGLTGDQDFKVGDSFGYGMPLDELKERIRIFAPDVVGISYMYTQFAKGVYESARIVKELFPEALVVCGGAGAASFEGTIDSPFIDLVVQGEGEETFLDILQRFERHEPLISIPGTVEKMSSGRKVNPPRPFIKDLDTLPFPDRTLLDMRVYQQQSYLMERNMRNPRMSIVASRGCPGRCVFCTIHCLWKHTYRCRSAQSVADEIELLYREYGMRELAFYDDNLTFHKDLINGICDEIIRRKIDIRWSTPNGVAVWTLDKATLKNMRRAGCYKIVFGLESGSLATLKAMHKEHIDPKQAKEMIRYSNRLGMWTMSPFLIGFPHETKEDLRLTFEFAVGCGLDKATFFVVTPYPGSELFTTFLEEGLLPDLHVRDDVHWTGNVGYPMVGTHYFTREELAHYRWKLNHDFIARSFIPFLNPLRLLRKMRTWEELSYVVRLVSLYFFRR